MFLCLLERKFPELFKTHPIFSSSPLQKAKKSTYAKFTLYGGHPVEALKGLRKTVEAYIIKCITSSEPPVGLKSQ